MNELIKKLTDQAGFVRFSREEDENTPIDWSSNYDDELNKYTQYIIEECILKLNSMHENAKPMHNYYLHAALQLQDHFKK